ncbi:FAD-binding oxidoreductase [Streptomyces sp. CB01201]|uniref:FAD-binding and (Fe-S)-binding domain-containing protein n=1 Tax=Streptomyces sp. CB01201 TaxID=2020324 RepID=UPI000C278BB1|nr:FAD-binding and (Fe-S)-binding domain-containing protein [Streptomyces sp. CB01201]PJN01683.1 FAD-binding oxidoreductase [Streptomyces sp. CB01201]
MPAAGDRTPPPSPHSPPDPALGPELEDRLRRVLDGEVRFDHYTRRLFSRDASMYAITPLGVAFPRNADEVQAAVQVAGELGVPIVPRGAGTSLAGQTVGAGLVLDLSRHLDSIVEIDPEARTAVVEPGVVQDQLNRAAAPHGLMFGPDTSTSDRATIGGMIGNNSAGSGSLRHGMTIDHVRGLDVVLSDASRTHFAPLDESERLRRAASPTLDGLIHRQLPLLMQEYEESIRENTPDFWRRACGYRLERLLDPATRFDLARFVVGSEGTLAIVTGARVDLVPRPAHTVIAVGHFSSVAHAVAATEDALACDPAAVELLDRTILDLSLRRIEYAALGSLLTGEPGALLFVTFSGDDRDRLSGSLQHLTALWRAHQHGYHTLTAETPREQRALLTVRKAGLGLLMAASEGSRRPLAFVEDTAVDPVHLADYTRRFQAVLDRHGLTAGFYGHCSVGCLHIRPFVDLTQPAQVATMREVAEEVRDLVTEYGGVNSSEHGDGLARSEFNPLVFGAELYEAMRRTKQLFDPHGLLNPGKIVDAPPMTEHLRDVSLPPAVPVRTRLDFEVVGGMRGAADRCMNIGQCRKSGTGAMCPSYMATHEEEHSTRGRANALVTALSEPDPRRALGDERLHGILDLCLMCKACKSECPLGVDMAALKAETLSHHHDLHGTPFRSRLFGAIRLLQRIGSATAPLSNLPGRSRPLRRLLERWPGITAARPLPTFARENLVRWYRRRTPHRHLRRVVPPSAPAAAPMGELTFLADSFTTYTEPGIGRSAIELLEYSGWRVRLVHQGCCGRASLSKGLLDDAKRASARLSEALAASGAPDAPITGCEPSCLMTLRDEHLSLHPGSARARAVAGRVRQLEELLCEAVDSGRLRLRDTGRPVGRRLLYQGHCHQKAEVGTAATLALLRRIPGAEVVELDAGCCGMAGSFGFETEHYELSMKVGEDRLLPAVRAEPTETLIVASGVSCRQQIQHGTGRRAWHPVELIRAVAEPS